jgi:polyhydroxyalkanoate synthesis repressor PhaR
MVTQKAKPTNEERIIKKYPNRRLYDTKRRSYITLTDIKQYVLDHIQFRVIDAQTEADLTQTTLFQVLTEQETGGNTFFTTELLQQMIRLYQANLQTLFSQYFEQSLTQFIQQKETWLKQLEKYQPSTSPFVNPFTAMKEFTQLQSELWESFIPKPPKK